MAHLSTILQCFIPITWVLSCDKECIPLHIPRSHRSVAQPRGFRSAMEGAASRHFFRNLLKALSKKTLWLVLKIFWELSVCECYSHRATAAMFHLYQYNRLGYIYLWLVVWNLFFSPYIGNNTPNWLIFFRGVETTNQYLYVEQVV